MIDLIKGDCLIEMQNIPDKSIDAIICDLPYGTTSQNKWDVIIPFKPLFEQYNRIIKDNGAILLFCQMPFGAHLITANEKYFRYEIIYQKPNAVGFLNANKMPLRAHENILVFYKKLPTYNPQKTEGKPYKCNRNNPSTTNYGKFNATRKDNTSGGRFPIDVIKFNKEVGLHPTQKPVPLLEYLIKTYTNEGETVLDNTMGSGSTGVACVNTNRNFIGIEMDDKYFEIAEKRINEAKQKLI